MRELLAVSLPLMISQASNGVMMFTDRFLVAPLGGIYPSASLLGGFMFASLTVFFTGYLCYMAVLTGQYRGAGQHHRLGRLLMLGVLISFLAWPLLLVLEHFLLPLYFNWVGVLGLERQLATSYTHVWISLVPETLLSVTLASFLSGLGKTRVVMQSQILAMLINIPVSYALIFWVGMGIQGSALGSVVAGLTGVVWMALAIWRSELKKEIDLLSVIKTWWVIDGDMVKTYLRYGAPMALEFALILLAFNTFVGFFHSYGEVPAIAMTITYNWDLLLFMPIWGINQGLSTLVGRFMGARRPDLAQKATFNGILINVGLTTFVSALLLLNIDAAVQIFLNEKSGDFAAIHTLADPMLRLAILYFFAIAGSVSLSGTLRAAGDTRFTLMITASAHWLNLLFAYYAIKIAHWGPLMVWKVHIWIYWLEMIFFIGRYLQGKWMHIEMVELVANADEPKTEGSADNEYICAK